MSDTGHDYRPLRRPESDQIRVVGVRNRDRP